MADKSSPATKVSLSMAQTQEGIGAELFSLCQSVSADGMLSKDEILELRRWLRDHQSGGLPGIEFLTSTLNRILADGRVSAEEQRELMEAIEKVLPADARRSAKAARREVEKQRKAIAKAAEKQAKEEQKRIERQQEQLRWPEDEFDFMVAGVHAENRHQLTAYLRSGDRLWLVREPNNPHDDCAVAVCLLDGRKIGYIPHDDAAAVAEHLDGGCCYVAAVKKVLSGGRFPIPVVVIHVFRTDQHPWIADLQPHSSTPLAYSSVATHSSTKPWWKLW